MTLRSSTSATLQTTLLVAGVGLALNTRPCISLVLAGLPIHARSLNAAMRCSLKGIDRHLSQMFGDGLDDVREHVCLRSNARHIFRNSIGSRDRSSSRGTNRGSYWRGAACHGDSPRAPYTRGQLPFRNDHKYVRHTLASPRCLYHVEYEHT